MSTRSLRSYTGRPLPRHVLVWTVAFVLGAAPEPVPMQASVPEPELPALPDYSECEDDDCCPGGVTVVTGDGSANHLVGGPGSQCLVGLGGDDALDGSSGDDGLVGGPQNDRLEGRSGHDLLFGGEGDDLLLPGSGDDRVWGGPGNDRIVAISGGNLLGGGEGDDTLRGGAHVDWIWGDEGDDSIDGGTGRDHIFPGPGLDLVAAGPGDDTIHILAACELAEGERIDGGPGFDRVVSPLPEAQVVAAGVVLTAIEEYVLQPPEGDLGPGSCFETESGEVVCLCCDQGQVENQCGSCGPGYHAVGPQGLPGPTDVPGQELDVADDGWTCEPDRSCDGIDCGSHGTCSDAAGTPDCICEVGYTGGACDDCAAGWEEDGDSCEIAEDCSDRFCNGHGSCEVDGESGLLGCDCDEGFEGPDCGPPDLQVALAKPAVQSQKVILTAELGDDVDCDGDFEWEVVEGSGQLEVDEEDSSMADYSPDSLGPDGLTRVDVVRVTCSTDMALSFELGINVIELEGLPINGLPRAELEPLDEAMLQYLDDRGMPGATLAVTKDDELVFLRGYGWFDQPMTETMPTCAPMRVASVTKPFTQAAIVSLYGTPLQGGGTFDGETTIADGGFFPLLRIDPDTLVPDFIVPEELYNEDDWPGCQVPDTGMADIGWPFRRVKDFLSHRGGILSNDFSIQRDVPDPQLAPMTVANEMNLDDAPPSVFDQLGFLGGACQITYLPVSNYSNVGYNLLGRIVVDVSGALSYFDYLSDSILAPVGIVAGRDPDTTDQIYLGRSLAPDVEPEEPYYFSEYSDAGNVVTPFEMDGEWLPGADVPAPYGTFLIEAMDSHGGLVSKAETLTDFMRGYRIDNGNPRMLGEFSLFGMGSHYGSLSGTHSLIWQLPHSEDFDDMGNPTVKEWTFRIPGTADELEDLDTVDVELPKGVTIAVLFNKEEPRDNAAYPSFVPGTHDYSLLKDLLGVAVSEVESWPLPLTESERDLGCSNPLPPQDECGDGEVDAGEDCDGGPGAFECSDVGNFAAGELACTDQCQWDTSGCVGVPDNDFCDPETDGPGECPGAICAQIDGLADPLDPYSAFHGDGDTDGLLYCRDDTDWGRMTCVDGICKVCGDFEDSGLETMVGCPCLFTDGPNGCQDPEVTGSQNLVCFGGQGEEQGGAWDNASLDEAPGFCYDNDDGVPSFRCLANCPLLGYPEVNEGPFFCYTGSTQDSLGPKGLCLSDSCPAWSVEANQADECVSMGGLCNDGDGEEDCVAECDPFDTTSCQDAGYPDTWTCLEQGSFGGACVYTP